MTGLFDFSFYSLSVLVFLIFPESYLIHPIFQIYQCFIKLVHNAILLFFKSVVSVTLFSLSVLLHLFFFLSLVRGLPILLIQPKDLQSGDFMAVQWLRLHASTARAAVSIPGRGIRSHMPRGAAKNFFKKAYNQLS